MNYQTKQNDTLDDVIFRYYGDTEGGIVETVLEANRGMRLADYGPILPSGILLSLPDRQTNTPREALKKLWD